MFLSKGTNVDLTGAFGGYPGAAADVTHQIADGTAWLFSFRRRFQRPDGRNSVPKAGVKLDGFLWGVD